MIMRIILLSFFFISLKGFGQTEAPPEINVSESSITLINFPTEIESTRFSLTIEEQIGEIIDNNTIFLQATSDELEESNYIVKTTDGLFYNLKVKLDNTSKDNTFFITQNMSVNAKTTSNNKNNTTPLGAVKNPVLDDDTIIKKVQEQKDQYFARNTYTNGGIALSFNGVYVRENKMFFVVTVINHSNIDYELKNLIISSRSKGRGNTSEEINDITINKIHNNFTKLTKNDGNVKVILETDTFTISPNKKLYLELLEQNGERNIELNLPSNVVSKAEKL